MNDCGSLELAAARLGARWGRRADAATWRRLEATRSLAAALEVAQGGGLAPWVEGLTAASPVHEIERALRRRFERFVHELAGWMPAPWQAALRWCAVLPELPLVRHLAAGEPAPPWLEGDAAVRARWLGSRPAPPAGTAGPALPAACSALRDEVGREPGRVLAAWRARWRRFAPPGAARDEVDAAFDAAWPAQHRALALRGADARALRHALQAALVAQWRRAPLEPLAAFLHVALLALEYERVRGELVGRAAFRRFPVVPVVPVVPAASVAPARPGAAASPPAAATAGIETP